MIPSLVSDYVKYYREVYRPIQPQRFITPNTVELETDAFILRRFSNGKTIPTIIFNPNAGHPSNISDLSPYNSLIHTLLQSGIKNLSAVEWKSCTPARRNESLDDLMLQTDQIVNASGGYANLIGLCQGGWQIAMYASLFKCKVNTLTLAGSPIDAHAGGGKLQDILKKLPFSFYKTVVMLNGGIQPGYMQLLGFKMLNPWDRFIIDYITLYNKMHDDMEMKKHRYFRDWYESTQDLAGKWYLQILKGLFIENRLINGAFYVLDKQVDLRKITCPTILIAGSKDDITLPCQVMNTECFIRTKKEDIHRFIIDAGHIGIFMGSNALKNTWPEVAKILQTYN